MKQEPVVVTGIGVVSPFGKGKDKFVDALKKGTLGKSKVTRFDVSDPHYAHPFACNIKDDLEESLTEVDDSKISTITLWAAQEALTESKIVLDDYDRYRVGLSLGTSHGGNHSLIKFLKQRWEINNEPVDYSLIFNTSATVGGAVAAKLDIGGPVNTVSTACSSGTTSVGFAVDLLQDKEVDIMFAGGADLLSELSFSGFNNLQALCDDVPRPFSETRTGLMLGEGAAMFVLERKSDAIKREVPIYAEVAGYAINNDAYHETAPHPEGDGAYSVMKMALENAGITEDEVDYVNMHGTSTQANDPMELNAVKRLFDEEINQKQVSSTKSMIGHALGAAGSLEIAATVLAMKNNLVLPTINFEKPIKGFEKVNVVPNKCIEGKINVAISNSFAFAGHLASIVLRNSNN